jgi:murein DD-endopeptidase MepM/ murein hydrolase activator NlpD
MCALRRPAFWPQVLAISLIGFGAAGCADSGRFSDPFGSDPATRSETTGSIPSRAPASPVVSRPLPPVASAEPQGVSGGGRGMGSYQPGNNEITGSVAPPAPPPPRWTWEGGTPITVAPGETLETIARKHNVPVSAMMQANNISNPASVHVGQHLVIPRYRPSPAAYPPATARTNTVPSAAPVGPPRTALAPASGVHVVAPGETLNSIARLYGKSVMVLARANNIAPDTMVRVGERIVIPDVAQKARAEAAPAPAPTASAPAPAPKRLDTANADSPHSAWKATPVAPPAQQGPVKTAEPAGGLPNFRWPVRGRVIAGFGPSPNGLQNDGIDLAVPQGTPVKAADDGVVAYAGNELKGYGNLVLIRHDNGYVTAYAHASEITVKRGETVKRGQVIAKSGETGNVSAPELHFEIRKGATPVDPTPFLNGA